MRRNVAAGRRALLAGLASALLLVGCASDPSTVVVPGTTTTTTTAAPGVAPGTAPTTAAPSAPTTHSAPPRTIIIGGTDVIPDPAPTTAPPRPAAAAPSARAVGGPGSIADLILGPRGPAKLALQILTDGSAAPRSATVDRLVSVLQQASGKPVRTLAGTVPARATWGSELRTEADAHTPSVPPDTLLLRFLFVHGQSDQGPDVLGIAVRGDVAAVFVDQVQQAANGLATPAAVERAVATHELGHLLGLVGLFRPAPREDKQHPGHSSDQRSVMYWAVESSLVGDLLTGGPPQDFDADDVADLTAYRRG